MSEREERDDCVAPSSFYDIERQARLTRGIVLAAYVRGAPQAFARCIHVLTARSIRVVRVATAERCVRRAIRELQRLDDRVLRDIGVTRGEIESAVRDGLPARVSRHARRRQWNGVPSWRQAA